MKREERWRKLSAICKRGCHQSGRGGEPYPGLHPGRGTLSSSAIETPLGPMSPREMAELREVAMEVASAERPEVVSDKEIAVLEAVVHSQMRPAILVQDGQPLALPAEWAHLEAHKAAIARAIASTGRVEIEGDPGLAWIGTGFVIDNGLVATNRHVLSEAAFQDQRHGWQFRDGVRLKLDFAEEIGGTFSHEVPVTGIWGVHSQYDIAILEMGRGCPPPLFYSPRPTRPGQEVVTIGYPAFDSRRNDAVVMQQIFRGIYDVKRLMPGELSAGAADPFVIRHDCSTLGGNSGSPVIEPSSGHVIGIHFRGFYLRWNEAVDFTPNPG